MAPVVVGDVMTATARKFATLGGDGQDAQFEQMFSQLAHAYTAAKAPSLEPFEIGFQLLERTDDGTRAAGVTGYVMGTQLLLAPVFWLRGQIKGTELLWLDSAKTFVPLKDNWLNYLQQRKPLEIGDTMPKDLRRLGVRQPVMSNYKVGHDRTAAWLRDLATPPIPKTATDAMLAALAIPPSGKLLPRFVRTLGKQARAALGGLLAQAPALVAGAAKIYGPELRAAVHDAELDVPPALDLRTLGDAPPVSKVAVTAAADGQFTLGHVKYAVSDTRTDAEVATAYRVASSTRLFNPQRSGIYDVLMHEPAGLRKCFVAVQAETLCPHPGCDAALVVDLDAADRRWARAPVSNVWATRQYEAAEYDAWLQQQPELRDIDVGATALLLTPQRALGVLRVRLPLSRNTYDIYGAWGIDAERMRIDNEVGRQPRFDQDTLRVAPDVRYIRLAGSYPDTAEFVPQSHPTLDQLLAKYARLALFTAGTEITAKTAAGQQTWASPLGALTSLMTDYGLRHDDARALLADAARTGQTSVVVKRAYELPTSFRYGPVNDILATAPEGMAPIMGGDSVTVREARQDKAPIDIPREFRQPKPVHEQDVARVASGIAQLAALAADRGQRDVFDAGALVAMLRTMRDEDLIDRSIPTLAAAMSEVGSLIYKFFWHQDDFAERFGDDEMPEMEDAFRNLFEALGDTVLKLRQKTVAGGTDMARLGVSLGDLAGAS